MRVLVLGGTRFLGPFVVDELLRRGHDVAVVSRRDGDFSRPVRRFPADAGDGAALRRAARSLRPEGLIDLLHPSPQHARVIARVFGGKVERSVHVSCASVYGDAPVCPVDEDTETIPPDRAPKQTAEQILADEVIANAAQAGKLPGTIVRLPELYGPRHPRAAEWFFAKRALDGRDRIALPDGGLHICHRGFVQNIAWGVVQALTIKRAVGELYNLGEEKLYTLFQLARGVARALRHQWELVSVPGRLWTTPYAVTRFFDLRKARSHLRYRDRMIPRDGLELTLAHLCQNPPAEWTWPGIADPFDYAREDALIAERGTPIPD